MDFWACAEEAERLWSGPGEKQCWGYKMVQGSKREQSQGSGTQDCLAAEPLAEPSLSPCLIFFYMDNKIPTPLKNRPGGPFFIPKATSGSILCTSEWVRPCAHKPSFRS